MGSATPDIKVFHAAQMAGIALARLDERVGRPIAGNPSGRFALGPA
jgi:hypothetical protein